MEHHNPHMLTREQKTGFVLLFVFAVLVVGLGFLQIRNTIYTPFVLKNEQASTPVTVVDDQLRLQSIDTDRDGINDYEEINFYETSPYLPDTDSDGIGDAEELEAGTDPLCPEGKECQTQVSSKSRTEQAEESFSLYNDSPLPPNDIVPGGTNSINDLSAENINALLNDPAQLREAIAATGQISPEQLEQIDDATLLEIARGASADLLLEPGQGGETQ